MVEARGGGLQARHLSFLLKDLFRGPDRPFGRRIQSDTLGCRVVGMLMRRREFLGVLGGAIAAGPAVAQAQPATMPVLGFVDSRSLEAMTGRLDAFHRGVKEAGFSEGENLKIEYRWANNQLARLSVEAGDLVRRQPSVIVTSGGPSAHWRPKPRPRPYRSYFLSAKTRPGSVLSTASADRAATSPASICLPTSWKRSGWNCSIKWCHTPSMSRF